MLDCASWAPETPKNVQIIHPGKNQYALLHMQAHAAETTAGAAPQVQRNKQLVKGRVQSAIY